MSNKYLVVFDTTTILQSLLSDFGPATKCLAYFRRGEIDVVVSRAILKEINDVLTRSSIRERYKQQLTDEKINAFLEFLRYQGIYLRSVTQWYSYPRDPKDEPFINLAIEIKADYLVSRDNDLLDLAKWDDETGREFQKRFRFLKIMSPNEFLAEMDRSNL